MVGRWQGVDGKGNERVGVERGDRDQVRAIKGKGNELEAAREFDNHNVHSGIGHVESICVSVKDYYCCRKKIHNIKVQVMSRFLREVICCGTSALGN